MLDVSGLRRSLFWNSLPKPISNLLSSPDNSEIARLRVTVSAQLFTNLANSGSSISSHLSATRSRTTRWNSA